MPTRPWHGGKPYKIQTGNTQISPLSLLMITILPTGGEGLKETQGTHFGTTGSSGPFAASIASFHLAVHRHHLQPGSRPIDRKLFPREALKSRNSFVRTPISPKSQETPLISQEPLSEAVGAAERGEMEWRRRYEPATAWLPPSSGPTRQYPSR